MSHAKEMQRLKISSPFNHLVFLNSHKPRRAYCKIKFASSFKLFLKQSKPPTLTSINSQKVFSSHLGTSLLQWSIMLNIFNINIINIIYTYIIVARLKLKFGLKYGRLEGKISHLVHNLILIMQ
jgi:hypothetical protein